MAKADMTPLMVAAAKIGHSLRRVGGKHTSELPVDITNDLDASEAFQFFYQFGADADFITCINLYTRIH